MKDYERIGWLWPNGPLCDSCKEALGKQDQKECFPLFAGEVEGFLNPRDRSITCYTCGVNEIWEPDTKYAEEYARIEKQIIAYFEPEHNTYWCLDCEYKRSEQAENVVIHPFMVNAFRVMETVCASCDDLLLSIASEYAHHFEKDWGDVENILSPWYDAGFFENESDANETR